MLPKGLILCLDLGLGPEAVGTTEGRARYAAMILGMFREDVLLLPGMRRALPSPSLRHSYPRSRQYCGQLFDGAVAAGRAGEPVRGAFLLGRALHVLIDMACPVHAQGVAHYLDEPFERHVDAAAEDLASLPVPALSAHVAEGGPQALVDSLAGAARREIADTTKSPWGRVLRRWGYRQPPSGREIKEQARRLIPLCAAHVRALIAQYDAAFTSPVGQAMAR